MAYTVTESIESQQRTHTGAQRSYYAKWDGAGENSGELARTAIITHLSDYAEKYTTPNQGQIRKISEGSAIDYDHERRLDYWLHGFPATSTDVVEVPGTLGVHWRGTVKWGVRTSGAAKSPQKTAGASAFIAQIGTNVQVNVSPTMTGGVKGGAVDYFPLVYLLSKDLNTGETAAKAPLFAPGSLNAIEQDDDSAPIKIRGLNYNRPQADITLSLEVSGGEVSSAFKTTIIDAANDGTLNSDQFTIDGVLWEPLELLLVNATFRPEASGTTTIDLGFASGRRKTLTIGGASNKRTAALGDFVHGGPTFYFYEPSNPSTGPAYVSPHDYVWNFRQKNSTTNEMEVVNTSIHQPWPTAAYATMFGVSSL